MAQIPTYAGKTSGGCFYRRIAVGGEDFAALRKADSYYVDKTELLYDLVHGTDNSVTLFTRPRRFGKTLTMSMMENFFSIEKREDNRIFDGLAIKNHAAFCKEYMNQYPVIFVSLKDVEGLNFESALKMLKAGIADLCIKREGMEKNGSISAADEEAFHRLMFKEADVEEIKDSLKILMRMMNAAYGKKVILLIDEYDVPLAKAQANGYYRQMLDVIRGLMSTSLKTNEYLKFAVITGCLRIPKESIFTGVNNFASYSVLDDRFSQYFGFTEAEVDQMLASFDLSEKAGIIKEWYDGYTFGQSQVYCPWDVVNYVSELLYNRKARPKNYWQNTSGNEAIKAFFELKNTDISDKFEVLLNNGTITDTVTDSLTYDQAYTSEKNIWSILLMTGYVTTVPPADEEDVLEGDQSVELRIPNKEIAGIFQTAVVDHFNQTVDDGRIRNLMKALWEGDVHIASDILSDLLWGTISYMDYGEDYYHAFLTGIFVGRGGYSVRSNKEQGEGRPDIDLRDKRNRRAMIIEAKISESKKRMEHWCDEAIDQIVRNGYAKGLEEDYNEILCYGISFYKKSAMVKKL